MIRFFEAFSCEGMPFVASSLPGGIWLTGIYSYSLKIVLTILAGEVLSNIV
jgi:hypothetical protein